ncbi:hypothetical protein CFLV_05510 [Corynebacterium flavescens]|nr:hypothetical protein CFLV_05510 [Corynebacterium flavescens]
MWHHSLSPQCLNKSPVAVVVIVLTASFKDEAGKLWYLGDSMGEQRSHAVTARIFECLLR